MEFKSPVRYATRQYEQPVIRCYRRMCRAVQLHSRQMLIGRASTWATVSLRSPSQCHLRRTVKLTSAGYSNCNDHDNPKCANCVAAALSKAVKSTLRLMSTGKRSVVQRCAAHYTPITNLTNCKLGGAAARRGDQSKKWGNRGPLAEPPLIL